MQRRYQVLAGVAIVVVLLVAARVALPYAIRDYVNGKLSALQAYEGRIEDVDLSLLRGAYRIDGVRIEKKGSGQPTPFFSSERVDFSVEWRSLMQGSLVAEGQFLGPRLNLVQEETEQQSQLGKEENWVERLEQLFPFRFNTVRVRDGTVTFRAPGIQTQDALTVRHINGGLSNLTNVVESDKETFARYQFQAEVLEGGSAQIDGSVNPLAPQPTFDVNLAVKNVRLPQVNPWLRQFIKADAESGEFELFVELAAADGKFKGYAKPVMRDVNIYSSAEQQMSPLRKLWEGVVEFAANVFENEEQEQVAARVPFSGTIQHPDAGIFAAVISVVRNAFVSAFARSLEGSISVREVRRSLKDVGQQSGESDDKEKGKKDEDKPASKPQDQDKRDGRE